MSLRSGLRAGLLVLLLLTGRAAYATTPVGLGAELVYVNIGPGLYFVQYSFYADCSAPSSTSDEVAPILRYRATGCGNGLATNAGGALQLRRRSVWQPNPYCPQTNWNRCDTLSEAVNVRTENYATILNIGTDSSTYCTRWTLSVSYGTRAHSRNVLTDSSLPLYAETELNTRDVWDDSSPSYYSDYDRHPVLFVCDSTAPSLIPSRLVDPNNMPPIGFGTDSLVFTLEPVLSGPNQPLSYVPGYSPQQPLPTVPGHPVMLDPVTGALSFQAAAPYVPSPPSQGRNKYALAYRVTSWRREWGTNQRVRTGSVRFETTIVVFDCPRLPVPQPFPFDTGTVSNPGGPVEFWLDEPDTVTVVIDQLQCPDSVALVIQSGELPPGLLVSAVRQSATRQTLALQWNPDTDAVAGDFGLTVREVCTTCPISTVTDVQYVVRVRRRPVDPSSPSDPLQERTTAAPNPFHQETRLTLHLSEPLAAPAELVIFDALGRAIDRLPLAAGPGGERRLTWRPAARVLPGIYYGRGPGGVRLTVRREEVLEK